MSVVAADITISGNSHTHTHTLPTNPVWWGSIRAILSYHGNRPKTFLHWCWNIHGTHQHQCDKMKWFLFIWYSLKKSASVAETQRTPTGTVWEVHKRLAIRLIVVTCVLIDFQFVTSVAVWIRTFRHWCQTVHWRYQYWYKNVWILWVGNVSGSGLCHIARENVRHTITVLIHVIQH